MTRRSLLPVLLAGIVASACAPGMHAGAAPAPGAADLWTDGHTALHLGDFDAAETHFRTLAEQHPTNEYGREARFYLAILALDPRNPEWAAETALENLDRYLAEDTVGVRVNRRPEARSISELARQFVIPPEERISVLRPETRIIRETIEGEREETGGDLTQEVQRLRQQVAERDETIRAQREEIERIRRTLVPPDDEDD